MPKPARTIALAVTALAAAAVALPAFTTAQGPAPRDITVRLEPAAGSSSGAPLGLGDRLTRRYELRDAHDRSIGTLYSDCVNVGHRLRAADATLQCMSTYLFGDGQVAASGLVRLRGGWPGPQISIVGGTGAYHDARGAIEPGPPARGYAAVHVLHVDP